MGEVFLAHDDGIDRDVAVKLLRADDDALRRRFQTEARSAGRLKHPNIVTVYEFGEFEGEPYIIMEFVEGETLSALINREQQLSAARKLSLLIQACAGLGYAHRAGVVHRDIKPSNLMVDKDGILKIVDFGIARTAGRDLTMTGKIVGTPAYMSPEQIQGDESDHRSDIFSLGLVVFELLSGQCAYTGDSDYAVINRIVNGAPNPFRHPVESLEPLLRPVVDKVLSKDPALRHQSADQLAEDLARVLTKIEEGLPEETPRPSVDTAATILIAQPPPPARAYRRLGAVITIVAASVIVAMVAIRNPAVPPVPAPETLAPVPVGSVAPAPTQVIEQPAAAAVVPEPPPRSAAKTATTDPPKRPVEVPAAVSIAPLLTAATAAMAASDYDTAVAKFQQALTLDQSSAAASDGLTAARLGQNRLRAANAKSRIAEAEQKLLDGAYDDAIAMFESILKGDGSNSDALDGVSRARRAKAAEEAVFRKKKQSGGACD